MKIHPTRPWRAALAALALLWAPRAAEACAVCNSGRDDPTQLAFLLSALVMSVLPLGLVGGLVYWLVRRSRALERDASAPEAVGALLRRSSLR